MDVFLIILAVLAVIIILILNLSATITVVYEKGWSTKLSVLFIEKDIELSNILSFLLFPEKKAQEAAQKGKKKKKKSKDKTEPAKSEQKPDVKKEQSDNDASKQENKKQKPAKPNPIAKLWNEEGIVGIMTLISNLLETANSAVLTLFRGLHIYSLYVMIIVGGGDADFIACKYGKLCQYYYPLKGMILSGMKVDNYDDYIQPDFIAPSTETELQFIGSLSVGLILKMVVKAGFVFLKNFIKDKKEK